ncbi:signal peptidase I [Pelistega sp. NLN82]|uniref:Signal peptidase I n=1 Tax=Pelistega ratti TaxID=2652177 RepID=A0A6L9Y5L6_9BURK|nr:signal peptidase I [Pelistega ratti]NEN75679.1 signal peptidase I [Pelistega ratti]
MDFEIIFFVLLVVAWGIKLLDKWVLKPRRINQYGAKDADNYRSKIVDYAVSYFPVILFVFILRSFIFEPFRIPSGSMLPTLESGDMIAVSKFSYGIRLPIVNQKIIPFSSPAHGDVIVFRYPVDTSINYIKRVVGVPGDVVRFENKHLYLNGKELPLVEKEPYINPSQQGGSPVRYEETLGDKKHDILLLPMLSQIRPIINFPYMENCQYLSSTAVECKVPDGHYFVMGDNRDNSQDSRFWGFVPDRYILGKAFVVWMNFSEFNRIGTMIK